MALTIRTAVPDDAEAVTRVHTASWRWAYADSVPAAYLDGLDATAPWRVRLWRERYAAPKLDTAHLVADVDGVVVGFITVGPYRVNQDPDHLVPGEGEVRAIYVAPGSARTGVGSALLGAGLARLAAVGRSPVRLWVLTANARARAFYARFGFVPDGLAGTFTLDTDDGPVELPELRYTLA
jgi:GNAT superfamily N-acetyltransferase